MTETKYEASELAKNARKLFDAPPEVVTVALRLAGIESATTEEAETIVRAFLEKEVK